MNNINIPYSPPYCPLDKSVCEIWAILVSLHEPYTQIKIIDYIPHQKLIVEINKQRRDVDLSWAFKEITNDDLQTIINQINKILK